MSNSQQRGLRRLSLVAIVAGAFLSGAKPAFATPSGLSNYPSTDIYPQGNFHFDADYFSSTSTRDANASTLGLTYGTGPERDGLFGRSEFGFDYSNSGSGVSFGNRLYLNGKTQLYNNTASGVRAVAGFYGVGTKSAGAGNFVYLLGSKSFSFGRVHAGMATSLASREVVASNRTVLQLGFDKVLSEKFIFAVDYQSGNTQFVAPGLIYVINDKAGVQLSYLRGGSEVSPRNQIYFGFDYNFGKVFAPPSTENAPAGNVGGAGGGGAGGGG